MESSIAEFIIRRTASELSPVAMRTTVFTASFDNTKQRSKVCKSPPLLVRVQEWIRNGCRNLTMQAFYLI